MADGVAVGLIKTADQILGGRPRPVDPIPSGSRKGVGGRPRLNRKCSLPDCSTGQDGAPGAHWGHGYCRPHGRAFTLYGDPYHQYRRPAKCLCIRCPVHTADTEEEL